MVVVAYVLAKENMFWKFCRNSSPFPLLDCATKIVQRDAADKEERGFSFFPWTFTFACNRSLMSQLIIVVDAFLTQTLLSDTARQD
jgi:hypothetical protein